MDCGLTRCLEGLSDACAWTQLSSYVTLAGGTGWSMITTNLWCQSPAETFHNDSSLIIRAVDSRWLEGLSDAWATLTSDVTQQQTDLIMTPVWSCGLWTHAGWRYWVMHDQHSPPMSLNIRQTSLISSVFAPCSLAFTRTGVKWRLTPTPRRALCVDSRKLVYSQFANSNDYLGR